MLFGTKVESKKVENLKYQSNESKNTILGITLQKYIVFQLRKSLLIPFQINKKINL
jgi:hypothetical protein